jgi:hypothetical protein
LHTCISDFDVTAEIVNDAAKTDERTAVSAADTSELATGPDHRPAQPFGSAAALDPIAPHAHVQEEQHDEENRKDDVQHYRASRTG